MTTAPPNHTEYAVVHADIVALLEVARRAAARSVNAVMTATYWEVGRRIVEFEQGGQERAAYGQALLKRRQPQGSDQAHCRRDAAQSPESKLKRKGVIPLDAFGIDPLIEARRADIPDLTPAAQPIAGVPLPVMMLSMVRAVRLIRNGLGRDLTDDEFGWIRQRWADGVPENQVTGLIAQFSRSGLTDVAAGAAQTIERVA